MAKRSSPPSERVRVKRIHNRGHYDRGTINAILDASPMAHVGYLHRGTPFVTPTFQWREGDHVYWHGSAASRMLKTVDGTDVCVTVTLLDGMVMARSAFFHSANYRSVMIVGKARNIVDPDEKVARLKSFVDVLFPGRWDILRPMTKKELKATSVLSLPLDESSAKIRTGPPGDPEEDLALDIWAGVLPLQTRTLPAIDDTRLKLGLTPPDHVTNFRIG